MTDDSQLLPDDAPLEPVGEALFEAAALAGAEREAFLADLAERSPEVAAQVREMLPYLAEYERRVEVRPSPEPQAGDLVGGFRLVRVLGDGGFGRVWRAEVPVAGPEEKLPDVALKLLKAGTETAAVLRRFRREQRVLARLQHSCIASIENAGRTDAGRPYLVMELVEGREIADHVEQAELDRDAVLELFVRVCRAVEHAHAVGVLHRDLKPANILVAEEDGKPLPKVIDFGIASMLAAEDDPGATRTGDGRRIGSPSWMSPEQAGVSAAPVDVRSDVFALGRILHRLLVGAPAVDLSEVPSGLEFQALDEVFTHDAPSPRREARRRGAAAVPRALDAIVRRASATAHARRYPSVQALREDVERFLAGELVLAEPPGALELARYWLRRHRAALIPAAALVLGLVGVLVATARGRTRTLLANERLEATVAFQASLIDNLESAALAPTLRAELMEQLAQRVPDAGGRAAVLAAVGAAIDPVALARSVVAHGILDPVEAEIERALDEGRAETAALALAMIDARRRFGVDFGRGELAANARGLITEVHGERSAEAALVLLELANAARRSGDREAARGYFEELCALGADGEAEVRIAGEWGLAQLAVDEGRLDEAEPILRDLLEELAGSPSGGGKQAVNAWVTLGAVHEARLDPVSALECYERACALVEEHGLEAEFPGRGPRVARASLRATLGDPADALRELEAIVPDVVRALGLEDERTSVVQSQLARARQANGDLEGALRAHESASIGYEARHTSGHPNALRTRAERAGLLAALGRAEESLELCDSSLEVARVKLPAGHEVTARLVLNRVVALAGLARLDEAVASLDEALAMYEALHEPGSTALVQPYGLAAEFFGALDAMRPDQGYGERAEVYRERLR